MFNENELRLFVIFIMIQLNCKIFYCITRYEIRLLLYRYLKHKFPGAPARAEEEFNCLLRLLSQLETCKNIHVHGRIHNPTNEEEIANVVSYTPI